MLVRMPDSQTLTPPTITTVLQVWVTTIPIAVGLTITIAGTAGSLAYSTPCENYLRAF